MKRTRTKRHLRMVAKLIKSQAATGTMGPGQMDAVLVLMKKIHHSNSVRDFKAVDRAIDQLALQFLKCKEEGT